MSRALKEHDYIGLSEVSLIEQTSEKTTPASKFSNLCETSRKGLNLKATELRLALPGSEFSDSAHRDDVDDEIGGSCSLGTLKSLASGAKRGFYDTIDGGSTKWVSPKNGGSEMGSLKNVVSLSSVLVDDDQKSKSSPVSGQASAAEAPSKAQVVGWPPIRSSRKNSMAANVTKTNDDKDYNTELGCLYIKVSMDGAPYLRKVDIRTYRSYLELLAALEKMFSGFTIGKYGSRVQSRDVLSNCRLMDDPHHSEYVLTYEDKDGDWMLVGDVPWNMFIDSCKRLRIMKSSEAIGLARATQE